MVSLLAALSALKTGAELRQTAEGEKVGIDFAVKEVLIGPNDMGGKAVLAFAVLTNESDSPRSVTDIVIDFGTVRARRVPLTSLRHLDFRGERLEAESFVHSASFENVGLPFQDYRFLPDDIYLLPHESKSGCALFVLDDVDEVSKLLVIVDVGGVGRLSRELEV